MDDEMFDGTWEPYELLNQLAHEAVNLNERLLRVEMYLQEAINQNANIANHLADQSKEINDIYNTLGQLILNETK